MFASVYSVHPLLAACTQEHEDASWIVLVDSSEYVIRKRGTIICESCSLVVSLPYDPVVVEHEDTVLTP